MRILFVSQYFPPETGAPQNRLLGLAKEFKKSGVEIVVLTAMPNYPEMKIHDRYRKKFYACETMETIEVHRSWIYVSRNRSLVRRMLNYFSFVFTSLIISFRIKGKFDYVLCESPPLFLGISAWLISKFKHARFIFNVSDLWPESAEKLGIISNKYFLKAAEILEEFLYRRSFLITGQTQGIVDNIKRRIPGRKVHWLPNGIDEEQFIDREFKSVREELGFRSDDFILIYAGILGHAQGLRVILKAAERLKENSGIKFLMVGDGPEKTLLMAEKERLNISNVIFHQTVPKEKIVSMIYSSDAAIIPLKKIELFKGAIPSKIFENLILEKPILLGVDGEARQLFIERGKCGIFFTPEDDVALANAVLQLYSSRELCSLLGKNGKNFVLENFTRDKILMKFLKALS
jgi:glycosyltransferase involved in cell wall biosynthesis